MEGELTGIETLLKKTAPTEHDRRLIKSLIHFTAKGQHRLKVPKAPETTLPVIHDGEWLRFKVLHELEIAVLSQLEEKLKETPLPEIPPPDLSGSGLMPEQKAAVLDALKHPVFFLTGGPGTGKTHTAGLLIKAMKQADPNLLIGVAAPTGKAVSQLKKSLLKHLPEEAFEAKTLHAMLEAFKDESPIQPYQVILVDEGSMIHLDMFSRLMSALRPNCRLIVMGDPWQLPPVEAGAIFKDLVEKAPGAKLTRCLRADLKEIVELSERIKAKDFKATLSFLKEGHPGIEWVPNCEMNFSVSEKMCLTPLKKGPFGSLRLNQKALNECLIPPYPIIITRNHNELMLYNGDMGVILAREVEPGVKARFDAREIPAVLLPSWEYAWALSIHKSQGSEFDDIRILLPDDAEDLTAELLYTAVTRAKKSCTLHASELALSKTLQN
ncbi:MAG: AAA family ATPase [Chlamydiia bacterium]|nr:AAA family ATPase [Chlamydiia bacterium]